MAKKQRPKARLTRADDVRMRQWRSCGVLTLAAVIALVLLSVGVRLFRVNPQAEDDRPHRPPVHGGAIEPVGDARITAAEEEKLLLTPGGLYTAADVVANGNTTASRKYKGLRANHDAKPMPGERICPITQSKANPDCTWVVGGATYEFCCPPCIDEFVRRAKEQPQKIKPPEKYVEQ